LEAHDKNGQAGLAGSSTAQIFALIVGALLTVAGVAALVVNFSFATGGGIDAAPLLFLDVNGFSGLLMLGTGLGLLAGARSPAGARRAATVVGSVYLVVTIWSLFNATVARILPVNDLTAIVFAAVAVLGLTAGLAPDPRESRPS
jgi:hypothetical protein